MGASETGEPRGPNYQVRALARALDILDAFSLARPELTLTEISEVVDLPLSTTKRLVSALEERGYLEHSPETELYRVGIRAFEVGSIYIQSTTIDAEAHPTLEWLARSCQQTANLAVLDRDELVHIAVVPPVRPIRYFSMVGEREQVYCTGLGKALISEFEDERLRELASRISFEPRTRRTITNLDMLRMHLQEARERGFAMDDEESVVGLRCVAAPVRNARGGIEAAVSVSGPAHEFGEESLPGYVDLVKRAASEISSRLGYGIRPDGPREQESHAAETGSPEAASGS